MDIETRIAQFEKMATDDPTTARAHFSLGGAYQQAGRFAEAAQSYLKCGELNPGMSKAYQLAGAALIATDQPDRAGEILLTGFAEAGKRGDLMPKRAMGDMLGQLDIPLPEIEEICTGNRKIGLGVMGFADTLFKLGVRYDSDEGVAWGERFMKFLNDEAHSCSERLAQERGCFPNWQGSTWDTKHHRAMRNACCTTVAPTGTISIIADCSCGIEPLFSLVFYRNVLIGQTEGRVPMVEVNDVFKS
ncbi:MAG: tetratricopeptide repeat protein, partial [Henriciella sp.]|nr:tetratricopeptide repeat protein [Henriciella sp.]